MREPNGEVIRTEVREISILSHDLIHGLMGIPTPPWVQRASPLKVLDELRPRLERVIGMLWEGSHLRARLEQLRDIFFAPRPENVTIASGFEEALAVLGELPDDLVDLTASSRESAWYSGEIRKWVKQNSKKAQTQTEGGQGNSEDASPPEYGSDEVLRKGESTESVDDTQQRKPKRSFRRNEAKERLIAALSAHHKYGDGGCTNLEPIGNNELARQAGVAKKTASSFFAKQFKGYDEYRAMCLRMQPQYLVAALRALRGEYRPHEFRNARSPEQFEQEAE